VIVFEAGGGFRCRPQPAVGAQRLTATKGLVAAAALLWHACGVCLHQFWMKCWPHEMPHTTHDVSHPPASNSPFGLRRHLPHAGVGYLSWRGVSPLLVFGNVAVLFRRGRGCPVAAGTRALRPVFFLPLLTSCCPLSGLPREHAELYLPAWEAGGAGCFWNRCVLPCSSAAAALPALAGAAPGGFSPCRPGGSS
jgi:hypothetical protein